MRDTRRRNRVTVLQRDKRLGAERSMNALRGVVKASSVIAAVSRVHAILPVWSCFFPLQRGRGAAARQTERDCFGGKCCAGHLFNAEHREMFNISLTVTD